MQITGVKELDRKLQQLPVKVQKKLGGQAIRAGLRVLAKDTKKQVRDPEMRRAVGSRFTQRKGGMAGVNVGTKKGRRWVPHFSLYVLGTRNRTTRSGADRGAAPSHPVVDQTLAAGETQALAAAIDNLKKGIVREANR